MSNDDSIIKIWKQLITNEEETWIVFENGTCIILLDPQGEIEKQAIELLKLWGPVVPGTNSGDFSVSKAEDLPGWIIYYAHPDIANYVSPEELPNDQTDDQVYNDMVVGLIGRNKRQEDSQSLKIIYVEDNRK